MAQLQVWEDGMATLYLTEPRSLVKKDGDTLVVQIPENKERGTPKRKVRVPLIKVTQVVVYGDVTITSPALAALLEQRVDVCFCSYYGRFRGRLAPPMGKNSLIRLEQHRAHNDPVRSFTLARAFVRGKLANMRAMLMRANRKRKDPAITQAVNSLKKVLKQVEALEPEEAMEPKNPSRPQADTLHGTLLGLEGSGTAFYYGVFGRLLKGDWGFTRRQRRPPKDPINALLSFGYVLLMNQVASAVSIVGLDPYVGFLHSSQFGKPALALDVMEAFRPLVVDSVVMTLINNGMLNRRDFQEELGAWRLTEKGRRTFLTKFEERLETEIKHPVFGYRATYRRCLELEVRLVAKWLTGEIRQFRPFVVR
ncbi:MAG: type I-D CRISPR-associated endonuclease Cas1 [Chloroflexi bacterium]|nr:MAG: type I-D CRISPR-associated endonuclease Cas1 [Chloroflexota bacterium]